MKFTQKEIAILELMFDLLLTIVDDYKIADKDQNISFDRDDLSKLASKLGF